MSIEKIVLIFALLGSAKVVLDMVASVIASAVAKKVPAPAAPLASRSLFQQQVPPSQEAARTEPTMLPAQSQDKISRMLGLMEAVVVSNEALKDQNEELVRRVSALEAALAKPKAPRATKARQQTETAAAPAIPSQPEGSIPLGPDMYAGSDRFEIVK